MHGVPGRLPNFFLAGAPKTGSTSLNRYLEQHPQIFMSPVKEPHFFADEVRMENFDPSVTKLPSRPISSWEAYRRLFDGATGERAIGEASVCYLWSPTAAANIVARIPHARFLLVLRNPVDRAFSQYVHMLSFTDGYVSFREHVERSLRSTSTRFTVLYPFLELGLYGEQLERLFQVAPRHRVRIDYYEDYCRDPAAMLRGIFEFLGVEGTFQPDFSRRFLEARVPRWYGLRRWLKRTGAWEAARRVLPGALRERVKESVYRPRRELALTPADRAFVAEYYRRDLDKLATLLGRDFSGWLNPPPAPPPSPAPR